MKITLDKELSLLDALTLLSPSSSKTTLRSWIKEERVSIDYEKAIDARALVAAGQTVAVSPKKKFLSQGVTVLYEGQGFIVIDKPCGLLSVSTETEKNLTAYAILKKHYAPRKISVVHRLDRETSGVMVFGLGQKTLEPLKELFEAHRIERRYRAIVEGHLTEKKGCWRSYLFEDANFVVHPTRDKTKGKLAITHYTVIGESKRHSLLDIELETGKKNQVRVQCQEAGHPVAGDTKYGATSNPINRLCLHAYMLAFQPPGGEKVMHFYSPIPEFFSRVVDA